MQEDFLTPLFKIQYKLIVSSIKDSKLKLDLFKKNLIQDTISGGWKSKK